MNRVDKEVRLGGPAITAIYARRLPKNEKGNPTKHDFRNWTPDECREYMREVLGFKLPEPEAE